MQIKAMRHMQVDQSGIVLFSSCLCQCVCVCLSMKHVYVWCICTCVYWWACLCKCRVQRRCSVFTYQSVPWSFEAALLLIYKLLGLANASTSHNLTISSQFGAGVVDMHGAMPKSSYECWVLSYVLHVFNMIYLVMKLKYACIISSFPFLLPTYPMYYIIVLSQTHDLLFYKLVIYIIHSYTYYINMCVCSSVCVCVCFCKTCSVCVYLVLGLSIW